MNRERAIEPIIRATLKKEEKKNHFPRLIYALAPIRQIKKRNLAPSPRKS